MSVGHSRTPPVRTPDPLTSSRRRALRRLGSLRAMGLGAIGDIGSNAFGTVQTLTWDTATDWDNAADEAGVVHESIGDFAGADSIQIGYPSFDRGGSALEGYWHFFENAGTTVNDLSGNGNDLTRNGSTQGATGIHNSDAYNHDGADDYVDGSVPQDPSASVFLWYKSDQTTFENDNAITFSQRDGNGILHHPNGGSQDVNYYVIDSGGSTNQVQNGGSSIGDVSVWRSYAFVYDDANTRATGYVDGSVDVNDTSFSVSRQSAGATTTVSIGKDHTFSRYADGTHGVVRLYNRALSDAEVSALHSAGTSGYLETATKSFSTDQTPDLSGLSYTLNGQTIDLKVIGSPGEAGEETVTQTLDGSSAYALTWSGSHTNFRLRPEFSTTDVTTVPVFSAGTLTT